MELMKLIADSGSSKCTWMLVDGTASRQVRTRGINAVLHAPDEIRSVLAEVPFGGPMQSIHFYGAGCGEQFPTATEALAGLLRERFEAQCIAIESDLLGAARALFGRGEGIVCILGTGSNTGRYDGRQIVQHVPPLGYILGDEGSGAALGRAFLNGIFKGHIPLREEFLDAFELTYEEVICRIYRAPVPNRFLASLCPFIRERLERPEVEEMVRRAFREFAERNLSRYPAGATVSLVGGVAYHFSDLLRETLAGAGYRIGTIVASPDEGLIAYHGGR